MARPRIRIVLQARTTSSRLPAKVLLPLGGLPLAVLCARRLQRSGAELVLATSHDRTDDAFAMTAERAGLRVFRGSLDDVLSRFVACIADLDDRDVVVRMTADNPVPDGDFVDQLVAALLDRGLPYVGSDDGLPYGLGGEAFLAGALRHSETTARSRREREHVTPRLIELAGPAGVLEPGCFVSKDLSDLRCTIDNLDDYLAMRTVFDGVGDPVGVSWRTLLPLLPRVAVLNVRAVRSGRDDGDAAVRVALGGAQFGMDYGIANRTGRPSDDDVRTIVRSALAGGVTWFDTARAYGDAEVRLGVELAGVSPGVARICTKLAPLTSLNDDAGASIVAEAVEASVFRSCHALQRRHIDVMLFHGCADMYRWGGAALDHLTCLVDEGIVGELGVSVYTPEEAIRSISDDRVTYLQVPFNLLDTRWLRDEFQAALRGRPDLKVQARSVFLQGLLLSSARVWPAWFAGGEAVVAAINELRASFGRASAADLCMAYVRAFPWVATMILGVERPDQLDELLTLAETSPLSMAEVERVKSTFHHMPDRLLIPALW